MKKRTAIIILSVLLGLFVIYSFIVTGTLRYTLEENKRLLDNDFTDTYDWEVLGHFYINGGDLEWAMDFVIAKHDLSSEEAINVLHNVREIYNSKVNID